MAHLTSNHDHTQSETCRDEWYQLAFERVQAGASIRAAAKEFGIPRSTLQGRFNGAISKQQAAQSKYRLSHPQEAFLIDWILAEEAAGRAPSLQNVTNMATAILMEQGDMKPLGKSWAQRFFERHSNEVKIKSGRLVDIERIQAVTEANIEPWFEQLASIVTQYNIRVTNLYNMDETGTQEGNLSARKVAGNASIHGTKVAKGSNADWVSTIECISASGRRLRPAIVFKGKQLQSNWAPPEGLPRWHYTATPSGWTNADIALNWMKEVFLPETVPVFTRDWRLLILDGFSTHINHFFQLLAFRNRVQLYYLPAHTSHRLQPLDVAVFAPLKTAYRNHIQSTPTTSLSSPA